MNGTKNFKLFEQITQLFSIFVIIFFLYWKSGSTSFFIDEIINLQAIYSFLTSGVYESKIIRGSFNPAISSGIATTLPSGIGFYLLNSLFYSRIFSGFIWFLFLFTAVFSIAKNEPRNSTSFCISFSLFCCVSLFEIPIWNTIIQTLGELPAGMLLGLGIYELISQRYYRSGFLFGLSVWLGKFIYILPFSVLLIDFVILKTISRNRRHSVQLTTGFLIPLFLILALIVLFDFSHFSGWTNEYLRFIFSGGNSGLNQTVRTILTRFESPEIEWHLWALAVKIKLLMVLPASILAAFALRKQVDRQINRVTLGLCISVLIYTLWFFLISPTMWLRHYQPACFLLFMLLCFLVYTNLQKSNEDHKKRLFCALILVFISFKSTVRLYKEYDLNAFLEYPHICVNSPLSLSCSTNFDRH